MISFINSLLNFIKYLRLSGKENYIVFFSESRFYIDHFEDLVLLIKDKNKTLYITSDKNEFEHFKKITNTLLLNNKIVLEILFAFIKCKCVIMTVTDLGNHLKKSNNCENYIYFFHALSSVTTRYTKEAFKNYDIVFTNGEYQKKELINIEENYNFPKKKILNTGYFFLDNLLSKINLEKKINRNIFFAPSWNYNKNLFDNYSLEIIELLLKNNFIVTLRPHPEHYKRSIKTIKTIKKKFQTTNNFIFDENLSNLDSMEKSSLLITDNSAIDMEYMLTFKRPIIQIKYMDKIHNDLKINKNLETIEDNFKKQFTNIIKIEEIESLPNLVNKLINNNLILNDKVDIFKKKYISNINKSSVIASKFILEELS